MMPIEMLGPKCGQCGFHHDPGDACRVLLTSDDLDRLRADWSRGILPDKTI